MISVFNRIENIMGKWENAGYKHLLIPPQCFQKPFVPTYKVFKTWNWVAKVQNTSQRSWSHSPELSGLCGIALKSRDLNHRFL